MRIKLKEISIDTEICKQISEKIIDTEMESMGLDEYIGEFNVEVEEKSKLFSEDVEILIVCSGNLIQRGREKKFNNDTQPEFILVERYINNMDIRGYANGEEVEFNDEEFHKTIKRKVTI